MGCHMTLKIKSRGSGRIQRHLLGQFDVIAEPTFVIAYLVQIICWIQFTLRPVGLLHHRLSPDSTSRCYFLPRG